MPTYYIDNLFANAEDFQGQDSQGNNMSIDLTYKISAKVYQNNTLISEHKNITKNWQTPIDTEVAGHYSIEYTVTDEFGATNSVIRKIEITPGLFASAEQYKDFIESGTNKTYTYDGITYNRGNVFQLGYYQNISPDGKYLCLNYLGNQVRYYPDYTGWQVGYNNSDNRHAHGAVLINTEDVDNFKVTEAIDILGGANVFSSAPGKRSRIAEVGIQNEYTSGPMVDMNNVPIVINGSPYTRARFASAETLSKARVDGFAYTLRFENNQWIVDSLFSSPYDFNGTAGAWNAYDDTRTQNEQGNELRFGRCVRMSKNCHVIAIQHSISRFSLYKRTGYFVHLIFKRSPSAPSTPTQNTAVPTGWSTDIPEGTNTLYACRVRKTSSGYSFGTRYRVAKEDYPHLSYSDGSWTVSSQDSHINIPKNIENQYGWTRFASGEVNGIVDCFCLNKAGTRLFVGVRDERSVFVYNVGASSVSHQATITRESAQFGESIQCDESGNILLVGGRGYDSKGMIAVEDFGNKVLDFPEHELHEKVSGSLHCFVYANGSWRDDSMSGSNSHSESSNSYYQLGDSTKIDLESQRFKENAQGIIEDITIENVQTSGSSVMYAQPNATRKTILPDGREVETGLNDREYLTFYHGRGFALSQDTNTLYVSSSSQKIPIQRWSSTKTYYTGNVVSYITANGRMINLYESLIDNNKNYNPTKTATAQYWKPLTSDADISTFPYQGNRDSLNESLDLVWNPAFSTYRESINATILVYKKVENPYLASGFYWNYEGVVTPSKSLSYGGWDIDNLDDISVPDNEATILVGGSIWKRYAHSQTASENNLIGEILIHAFLGYDSGRIAYPGGFALLDMNNTYRKKQEHDATPFYDLDSSTQDFVSQEKNNPNTLMPDEAFPPPESLPNNSANHELLGGYVCALKSTDPSSTFIVYIKHNDDRFLSGYYYVTAGSFSNGLLDNPNQPGAYPIDFSSEYQSFEESMSILTRDVLGRLYCNVYIFNQYKYSIETKVIVNPYIEISDPPPAPENLTLSYNKSASQMTVSWTHGIKNENDQLLAVSNQAEQYEITWFTDITKQLRVRIIPADYSNTVQSYTFDDVISTANYSIEEPGAENAQTMFFRVRAVNYRPSNNTTQYSETIEDYFYNFDFDENDRPGIPFFKTWGTTAYTSGKVYGYLDVFAPYQGYTGGKPTSLTLAIQEKIGNSAPINNPDDLPEESYYSLNKVSFTEQTAVFDDDLADRVTSLGFRHRLYIEEEALFGNITIPSLNAGSTYYFWVKLENEFGSSNWQALLENDSGGITFD